MKKASLIILLCLLAVLCTGCRKAKPNYTAFPKDYTIATVSVGGMTIEEASEALAKAADEYRVDMTLDGISFSLTSADVGLRFDKKADMQALLKAANSGLKKAASNENNNFADPSDTSQPLMTEGAKNIPVFKCKSNSLLTHVVFTHYLEALIEEEENLNISTLVNPSKASIKYDSSVQSYVGVDGVSGDALNYDSAVEDLINTIGSLNESIDTITVTEYCEGELASESEAVSNAIEVANKYLETGITLGFSQGEPASITMSKDEIAASFELEVDGLTLLPSQSKVADFCNNQMAGRSVIETKPLKYVAATQNTYELAIPYLGQAVS